MITSKDNPRVKRWARLVQDARLRRKERRALVEGPHLVALAEPLVLLASESGLKRKEIQEVLAGREAVVLPDKVFRAIVDAESPQGIAAEIEIPKSAPLAAPAVFLEGVQDPGNVGTILRSAAAFGVKAAVLDRACADPWSPKVLRAGMGAHFGLRLIEAVEIEALDALTVPCVATSSHRGDWLHRAQLPHPCAWLMGQEGQGISADLEARATRHIRIAQPGGEESLNVAAAAAICLHASAAQAAS